MINAVSQVPSTDEVVQLPSQAQVELQAITTVSWWLEQAIELLENEAANDCGDCVNAASLVLEALKRLKPLPYEFFPTWWWIASSLRLAVSACEDKSTPGWRYLEAASRYAKVLGDLALELEPAPG